MSQPSPPTQTPVSTGISIFANPDARPMNFGVVLLISLLLHGLLVGLIAGTLFLMNLLGFNIPLFTQLQPKARDIEFVLVENPEAPPRDKKTKNRSDRMSRSGGKKIPKMAQAEPQKAAGSVAQKPSPRPAPKAASKPSRQPQPVQRPQPQRQANRPAPRPRPQPQRVAQAPQPTPRPNPTPPAPVKPVEPPKQVAVAPPSPKLPTPKQPTSDSPITPPNPIAPTIKTPVAPSPKTIATGPIVPAPGMGSSSGSSSPSGSGSIGPTQIPGGVSPGSRSSSSGGSSGGGSSSGGSSAGSRGGQGGRSSGTQAGSPGGGGGRPGIDAMPEPDFGPYIAELQRRIKRNWNPPSDDRDKRIVAMFTIARDGRLLSLRIQTSSGVKVADEAALNAVRASAPFRQLPANFRGNDIDVQFIFDYNVYRGRSSGITYSQ